MGKMKMLRLLLRTLLKRSHLKAREAAVRDQRKKPQLKRLKRSSKRTTLKLPLRREREREAARSQLRLLLKRLRPFNRMIPPKMLQSESQPEKARRVARASLLKLRKKHEDSGDNSNFIRLFAAIS